MLENLLTAGQVLLRRLNVTLCSSVNAVSPDAVTSISNKAVALTQPEPSLLDASCGVWNRFLVTSTAPVRFRAKLPPPVSDKST